MLWTKDKNKYKLEFLKYNVQDIVIGVYFPFNMYGIVLYHYLMFSSKCCECRTKMNDFDYIEDVVKICKRVNQYFIFINF